MCLYVLHFHIRKAKKDIECWKVLTPKGFTPFVGEKFSETPLERTNINWGIPGHTQIDVGYIHVYKNRPKGYYSYRIHKAIIPKGTKYWYGVDSSGDSGYAAKCVKLID